MRAMPAVGFAVLVLTGCGGGDGLLTKEELANQADAICAEFEEKIEALADPQNFEELEQELSKGVDELHDLEPPDELESQYDRWLVTLDNTLSKIDELESAAEANDQAAIQELVKKAEAEDAESDRLAGQLGMKECADD